MAERGLDGKTLLVTGGCGFIGSNLIHHLLDRYPDCRIINLDKLTYAGNPENLRDIESDPRYTFVRGDIRDRETVGELMGGVQGVLHLAAETHVDRSILDAGEFVLTDVYGTFVLLEAARDSDLEFFLHVSTDEVYGSRDKGFFRETDPINPSSPYAASKAGADRLAHAYVVTYGLPVIIVRPSNNYGPFQYPEKFIPLFTTNALEDRALPLYGDGSNVRDWLFVGDHCRALDLVCRKGGLGEVYNIGANAEVPNLEVAKEIVALLGKPEGLIRLVEDRAGHDRRYALECRKIRDLGWAPKKSFPEGLKETVAWYRDCPEWWGRIKHSDGDFKDFQEKYYKNRFGSGSTGGK